MVRGFGADLQQFVGHICGHGDGEVRVDILRDVDFSDISDHVQLVTSLTGALYVHQYSIPLDSSLVCVCLFNLFNFIIYTLS